MFSTNPHLFLYLYQLTPLGICPHLLSTGPHLHLLWSKLYLLPHLLSHLLKLTEMENPTPNSNLEKSDSTRDGKRSSLFLVAKVPDLFSLPDSPRNIFYHSLAPTGPRQIPRGPQNWKISSCLKIHTLVKNKL